MSGVPLTDNARQVFETRYVRKNADGSPAETIEGTFDRVVTAVVAAEDPEIREDMYRAYYSLLTSLDFLPNSPTFFGAGTPLGNLAACYVLDIDDDMGKSSEGIFSTLRAAALIQQSGGGNGFSFSDLRPKGDIVNSSMGVASGPVSFMKVYDAAFNAIQQGGARRSANMAVLDVTHPDIEEFISCKGTEGEIANFNISVGITDDFMQAVRDDSPWELTYNGKLYKIIQARDLFDRIVTMAHHNGEPGVLFLDRANADHPTPHLGRLKATNPCGEQFLLGYENCCLGSINLANHIKDGDVDWEKLKHTVTLSVRFLDNVIDVNQYVPAIPELAASARLTRRIGLGIMGLADVFYQLRIRYGSEESLVLAEKIMEFIHFYAMLKSVFLAAERGSFQAIEGSVFDAENFTWIRPVLSPNHHPAVDWNFLEEMIRTEGIRNAAVTTIAPTGTLSTVAGVEGYGCEPVFALAYTRHMLNGDKREQLHYVSPLFMAALKEHSAVFFGYDPDEIAEKVTASGSCQNISELPYVIRNTFVVSSDITPEEHVRMQAVLQKYVSNSISKTCNFPATATVEDVEKTYMMAWLLGCKGLTVYVSGSREMVVLETKKTEPVLTGWDMAEGKDHTAVTVWTIDEDGSMHPTGVTDLQALQPVLEYLDKSRCPSCEQSNLRFVEGCVSCPCGYSACTV
jgi:ribonucleoside-diphosphate reductase alpha chain